MFVGASVTCCSVVSVLVLVLVVVVVVVARVTTKVSIRLLHKIIDCRAKLNNYDRCSCGCCDRQQASNKQKGTALLQLLLGLLLR